MRNDIAMSSIAQNLLEKYYGLSRICNIDGSSSTDRGVDGTQSGSKKFDTEKPSTNVAIACDDVYQATEKNDVRNVLQRFDDDGSSSDSSGESCRYSFQDGDIAETLQSDKEVSLKSHFYGNASEGETIDASFVAEKNDTNDAEIEKMVEDKVDDDEAATAILTEEEVNCDARELPSIASSSLTTKPREHARRRFADLPAIPGKPPIYDPTFVDLTNAGIKTLSLDALLPYSEIRMLYLENNSLTELPDELFPALQSLEWLDVRNNQLYRLPNNMKSHPELRTLLLQGNKIEILPVEIGQIRKLKTLQVAGNPLVMPPKDVVVHGSSAILHFLRTRCRESHPQESSIPVKMEVQRKSLAIVDVSEDAPRSARQTSKASLARSQSIERRRKIYNECNGQRVDIETKQNRLFWMQNLTKWLDEQTSVIQRMKDDVVRKEWRLDKRSFAKSMEKVAKRQGEGDTPFAVDVANCFSASSTTSGISVSWKRNGRTFTPPNDIDEKMSQLLERLNEIQQRNKVSGVAPASKQQFLSDQVEKICLLRNEILYLQRYNDVAPLSKSRFERA